MSIKFKSFHDHFETTKSGSGMFSSTFTKMIWATEQVEEFIKEKNIQYSNIKDIKFSVDSEDSEHILLIYVEAEDGISN